jgi:hypothetical protein
MNDGMLKGRGLRGRPNGLVFSVEMKHFEESKETNKNAHA